MEIKVATWNLGHAFGGRVATMPAQLDFLRTTIDPDVVLLQEVDAPSFEHVVARAEGLGRGGRWGSAVCSDRLALTEVSHVSTPYSKHETPILSTIPGSAAAAQVALSGNESFVAVSLYGAFDHGYSVTTVHKQLSDLTPLLDSPFGKRVVIGGDLNCSTQVDPPHRARHLNLFERFASLGLVNLLDLTAGSRSRLENCWCDDEMCRHVQTHRHRNSATARPWHDDYLFATRALADKLVDCRVIDSGEPNPWSLSDHVPVVATFDL